MKKTFVTKAFSNWIYKAFRNTLRNPKYRWWVVLGALAYLLSPFDVVPDFLPIAGWIDDSLLATIVIAEVSQLVSDRFKTQKPESTITNADTEVVDVKAIPVG